MDHTETSISNLIYDTIQEESNQTDRSKQDKDNRLGISSLGHDRKEALLKIRQTSETDVTDSTAAWIGTVLGDAIEKALAKRHPDWVFQAEVTLNLDLPEFDMTMSLPGHPDIIIPHNAATDEHPQGVYDLKGFALDTPILTTSGWATMGTVETGQYVYDMSGNPTQIVAKSRIHHQPCYEARIDQRESLTCDKDHIWYTLDRDGQMRTHTTKELAAQTRATRVPLNGPVTHNDPAVEHFFAKVAKWNSGRNRVVAVVPTEDAQYWYTLMLRCAGYRVTPTSWDESGTTRHGLEVSTHHNPFPPEHRHRNSWRPQPNPRPWHNVRFTPVDTVPTQCIMVDSPTSSYLIGESLTPTHNSKAELESVRRYGQTQQQKFQVNSYAKAAIDAGHLDPSKPITVGDIYYDRSARGGLVERPHVILDEYDESVLDEIRSWLGDVIYAVIHDEDLPWDMPRDWVEKFCLAGEAEVVTRQGLRPISELAGQEVELLSPRRQEEGLASVGSWVRVPVREYGTRPLCAITLRRGRSEKVIHATAEHRWFIRKKGSHQRTEQIVATANLETGMALREVRPGGWRNWAKVPFAIAQGFVFGDGARGSLAFYPNSPKAESMMRYFPEHHARTRPDGTVILSGIPKRWKGLPSIEEDSSFLMSWLAGYFAADGSVSANHQCTLSSASWDAIQFVRSVCSVVGVRTGQVKRAVLEGFRSEPGTCYEIGLVAADLPEHFFLNSRHAERMANYEAANEYQWKVVDVVETDRVEPVYCAEVPDTEAFVLADFILSHNSNYASLAAQDTDVTGLIEAPEHVEAIALYRQSQELMSRAKHLKSIAQARLNGVEGSTGADAVRWVWVNGGPVSFERQGYWRMQVSKVRSKK